METSPTLLGEWQTQDTDIFDVGEIAVATVDLTDGDRYFRLRTNPITSGSYEVPTLEFGVLLTWSVENDFILETSTGPAGPWEAFQGVHGQIDDQMAAIISQDQTQNYFRTRKTN